MRQCKLCETSEDVHPGLGIVGGVLVRMCSKCFHAYERGRVDNLREMFWKQWAAGLPKEDEECTRQCLEGDNP